MKKLKNGAEVLLHNKLHGVVLAKWHSDPYVTWKMDREGNTYWGHYFDNYSDAFQDYLRRTDNV